MEWAKITKETSLEENKAIHRHIWDYAIEHGRKPNTIYYYNGVAYTYDSLVHKLCQDYFIVWPGGYCSSINLANAALYTQWIFESNPEKKAELARQIRDLPFKYELES